MALRSHSDLLLSLYASVLDDDAFSAVPTLLTEEIEADNTVLWLADESGLTGYDHAKEEAGIRLYAERYYALDPWVSAVRRRGLNGKAVPGQELVDDLTLRNSEFYSDFMRPTKTEEAIGAVLDTPQFGVGLGIHRSLHRPFGERQQARLQAILPHLAQVIRLRAGVAERDRRCETAYDALDAARSPVIICSPRGIVRFANNAATRADGEASGISLGSLARPLGLATADATRELHALIAVAAAGGSGGVLRVAALDGSDLFLTVAPLPVRDSWPRENNVIVIVRGHATERLPGRDQLGHLFDLTPAEAEIALGLLTGRSLGELREERGVTENTIRTQLAQVLAKTGTANQRELVRLLAYLA